MSIILFIACIDNDKSDGDRDIQIDTGTTFEPSWEPSDEPIDTGSSENDNDDDNDDGNDDDDEQITLLLEGDWSLGAPNLLSDPCGVSEFQEVSDFVPSSIGVSDSQEESFIMEPDGLPCERNETELRCDNFYFDEETSALGLSAVLAIKNEITGGIISASQMELLFDVTIQSCDGPGCFFIETALNFPCSLTQSTMANHL